MSKHRKTLLAALTIMLISLIVTPALAMIYQDGVYHDIAEGYKSEVIVRVIVRDGKLAEMEAMHKTGEEKNEYFTKAEDGLREIILDKQSIEGIDAISGATGTSTSILKAMEGIILQTQYIGEVEGEGLPTIQDTPIIGPETSPMASPGASDKPGAGGAGGSATGEPTTAGTP